jgi:hypothetical protein
MPWDGDRLPSARRYLKDRWLADELLYGIFVRLTNKEALETLSFTSLDLLLQCMSSVLARRDLLRRRTSLIANGAKRT